MEGIYNSLYWGLHDGVGVKGAFMALIIAAVAIGLIRYLKWINQ